MKNKKTLKLFKKIQFKKCPINTEVKLTFKEFKLLTDFLITTKAVINIHTVIFGNISVFKQYTKGTNSTIYDYFTTNNLSEVYLHSINSLIPLFHNYLLNLRSKGDKQILEISKMLTKKNSMSSAEVKDIIDLAIMSLRLEDCCRFELGIITGIISIKKSVSGFKKINSSGIKKMNSLDLKSTFLALDKNQKYYYLGRLCNKFQDDPYEKRFNKFISNLVVSEDANFIIKDGGYKKTSLLEFKTKDEFNKFITDLLYSYVSFLNWSLTVIDFLKLAKPKDTN